MWQVILGAVSALGGVALTQFWQDRREAGSRSYEHRREAHIEFLKIFNGYWNATAHYTGYEEGPAPSDLEPDQFDSLFNALLAVQVFASTQSYHAAEKAKDELLAYIGTNGNKHQDSLQATFDEYIRRMRKELGVR